jgi:hypothetical protein
MGNPVYIQYTFGSCSKWQRREMADIPSELGVQGALPPAGARGVPACSFFPQGGPQARPNTYEGMSENDS